MIQTYFAHVQVGFGFNNNLIFTEDGLFVGIINHLPCRDRRDPYKHIQAGARHMKMSEICETFGV